jgi:hypothetical protein
MMAKRAKAYRGEKRSKEIARQKKQEEKRKRRHGKKDTESSSDTPLDPSNTTGST